MGCDRRSVRLACRLLLHYARADRANSLSGGEMTFIIGGFFGFLLAGALVALADRYARRSETMPCRCDICERVYRKRVEGREYKA